MKLYIKNMVCGRCETLVKSELEKLNLKYKSIKLGEVEINDNISPEERKILNGALEKSGLGLLDNKKNALAEKIKNAIIDLVQCKADKPKVNLSEYLKENLGYDYAFLMRVFAEMNGITIERYFIEIRIELAKILLLDKDHSLIDISEKLHFSDVSHFCNQFKKSTGLTPTNYKQMMYKAPSIANI
jgi:hypothetical protein